MAEGIANSCGYTSYNPAYACRRWSMAITKEMIKGAGCHEAIEDMLSLTYITVQWISLQTYLNINIWILSIINICYINHSYFVSRFQRNYTVAPLSTGSRDGMHAIEVFLAPDLPKRLPILCGTFLRWRGNVGCESKKSPVRCGDEGQVFSF